MRFPELHGPHKMMADHLGNGLHRLELGAHDTRAPLPEQVAKDVDLLAVEVFMGLLPIMYSAGTGTDVMERIAAPMLGGVASSLIMVLRIPGRNAWVSNGCERLRSRLTWIGLKE